VQLGKLSAATGQTEPTVLVGMDWLVAKGYILYSINDDEEVIIQPGKSTTRLEYSALEEQLTNMITETAAYRAYFVRAPVESLYSHMISEEEDE
jgi:hypothetical protein